MHPGRGCRISPRPCWGALTYLIMTGGSLRPPPAKLQAPFQGARSYLEKSLPHLCPYLLRELPESGIACESFHEDQRKRREKKLEKSLVVMLVGFYFDLCFLEAPDLLKNLLE